jgi:type IV pilus assembly protein PilE
MNIHDKRPSGLRASGGFTLIELLVTLVIASILIALATSSYLSQARESRRAEVKTAILDLAGREERNYSTTNNYAQVPTLLGYVPAAFPIVVGSGYYSVNVVVVPAAPPNPATYTITATAIADQVNDAPCQTFTYTQAGVQQAFNSGGLDNTVQCWQH